MSNYVELYDVVINKITKAIYDEYVEAGIITQEMIDNQAWLFADDQFLSLDNLNKLIGIEAGAQVNIIEGINVNGAALSPNAKVVNIVIPTKLSDLENDLALFSGSYNDLTDKPTLFSGDYNDLANKPVIPSVDGLASKNYVDQKVADLVNSAPTTLDTLGELATALQENDSTVEALNSAIGNKANASDVYTITQTDNLLGNKVDKVNGKSLVSDSEITKLAGIEANANNYVLPSDVVQDSTYVHTDNNYSADEKAKVAANTTARHTHSNQDVLNGTTASFTTALKTKLDNINVAAQPNVIEDIKVNGVSVAVEGKSVDIKVPTCVTRKWS